MKVTQKASAALWKWSVVLVVCLGVFVQGCKNPKYTRWVGAGTGAVLGASIAAATGMDAETTAGIAVAGGLAGFLVGHLIYKEQMHLEAQKAASEARVEEARMVLKKYRSYNRDLQQFVEGSRQAVEQLASPAAQAPSPQQLQDRAALRTKLGDEITKTTDGAKKSDAAIKEFIGKVEAAQNAEQVEKKRQALIKENEALKAEEQALLQQIETMTALRGQLGGG